MCREVTAFQHDPPHVLQVLEQCLVGLRNGRPNVPCVEGIEDGVAAQFITRSVTERCIDSLTLEIQTSPSEK